MIIKHSGFDGSEVMREMERLEAKKNPDAVWKPEPIAKKASSFKSEDSFHNMIMLVAKLRDAGRVEEADRLMTKIAAYQKTAGDVHLYRAIDEDGDDLLEFAYPDGDVEVAPAQEGHGKVETPQSQHKKIVDIIQKTPTGKYASPTETLLQSVASDLGLNKKASVFLYNEAVKTLKANIPNVAAGPKFRLGTGPGSADLWQIYVSFGAVVNKPAVSFDMLTTQNKPRSIVKHSQWGVFEKALGNPDFEKNINSGAFTRSRLWKYIKDQVNKANEGLERIYNIPWGVVSELENTNPQENPSKVDSLLSRLENDNDCGWIVGYMASATYLFSKKKYDRAVSYVRNQAQPFINQYKEDQQKQKEELKKIKARMLAAKRKYDEALRLLPTNATEARKYCIALSNAIFEYQTEPMKAVNLAAKTNQYARDLAKVANNEDALKKIELDAFKMLNRVQAMGTSKKASLNTNIQKKAQSGADIVPLGPTAPAAPAAPAPARKAPAKPQANQPTRGRHPEFERWLDDVKKWQDAQDSEWWRSVKRMQNILGNLGSTQVLNQIKTSLEQKSPPVKFDPNKFQTVLRSTGYSRYGETVSMDGKWGEATSKAVNAAKEIIEMFGEEPGALEGIKPEGYLATQGKNEKDKIGELAEDIVQRILKFGEDQGIIGLAGTGATPTGTTKYDNTVFDVVPKEPKLDEANYKIIRNNAGAELTGANLKDLLPFESWLLDNDMVSSTGISYEVLGSEWMTILYNLQKRAEAAKREAKTKEESSTAKAYFTAVLALMDRFRNAWYTWAERNGGSDSVGFGQTKKVSLRTLAKALAQKDTGAGTGTGGVGARRDSAATGTEGTTGPDRMTIQEVQERFPIGYNIYPQSWAENEYDAGTQIFNNELVPGYRMIDYVGFRLNINHVRSAYNVDSAMAAIMNPARPVPMDAKLKILNRIKAKTPAGIDLGALDPSSPGGQIIQEKFNAYILSRIAGALANDVIRVANNYGKKQFALNNLDWADAVSDNAIVWARNLKRVERMAQRVYGADVALGGVSRTYV